MLLLTPVFVECNLQKSDIIQTDPNLGYNCNSINIYNKQKKHKIVVFVHGTIIPIPSPTCIFCSLKNSLKFGRRDCKTLSDNFYEQIRLKTFYNRQPISDLGLQKVSVLDSKKYPYAIYSANLYKNCQHFVSNYKNLNISFYTFGWDGRLSHSSRVKYSKILYHQITNEIENLKSQNSIDKVELIFIGHSHGGNVLLNLANFCNNFDNKLIVDKLILLGTPVQSETAHFVKNTMFKKIYSFYSSADLIQVIDILSTQDSISKRRYSDSYLNPNLTQIELGIGKQSPLHNELWLFGGDSNFIYREDMPLYPFPILIFIPAMLKCIGKKFKFDNELFININRDNNKKVFNLEIKSKINKHNSFLSIPEKIFPLDEKLIL